MINMVFKKENKFGQKYDESDVVCWFLLYNKGKNFSEIGRMFNIDQGVISRRVRKLIKHKIIKRSDGRIEWVCDDHKIGHTIAVPKEFENDWSWWLHGCDGCCKEIFKKIKNKKNYS